MHKLCTSLLPDYLASEIESLARRLPLPPRLEIQESLPKSFVNWMPGTAGETARAHVFGMLAGGVEHFGDKHEPDGWQIAAWAAMEKSADLDSGARRVLQKIAALDDRLEAHLEALMSMPASYFLVAEYSELIGIWSAIKAVRLWLYDEPIEPHAIKLMDVMTRHGGTTEGLGEPVGLHEDSPDERSRWFLLGVVFCIVSALKIAFTNRTPQRARLSGLKHPR